MLWYVATILIFSSVPEPTVQYWQNQTFQTKEQCQEYIVKNKVELVDSILNQFRNKDGEVLKTFEFFCEGKELPVV